MKTCTKCGVEKEATNEFFTKGKGYTDGFQGICKVCRKEYAKQYHKANSDKGNARTKAWAVANPDKRKVLRKAWREKNIDKDRAITKAWAVANPDKERARTKAWQKANPDKVSTKSKKWREANPDKARDATKAWVIANPEKRRRYNQQYKARKRNLPSTLTLKQWEEAKQHFNNRCAYCGKELPLAQDHYIALSKGGEYTHNNIIPACKSCNSSKSANNPFVWYPKQPFYSKKRENAIFNYLGYENNIQQTALV